MTQKDMRKLWTKYKGYILIAVILLVVIVTLVRGCGSSSSDTENGNPDVNEVEATDPDVDAADNTEANALEENTHASVEKLVTKFLDCLMNGDLETLEEITVGLSEKDEETVTARAKMYDSYENLRCYIQNGPEDDSYIVYLCYDIRFAKIVGSDTLIPDILRRYVTAKDENGDRYIRFEDPVNYDELKDFVVAQESSSEVSALYEDTHTRFVEALESDEKLDAFLQEAAGLIQDEDLEETSDASEGEYVDTSEATEQNRLTRVLESVNVRAAASIDSERLALAYEGDEITQIESYEDGWSKVRYNGIIGYVKTEFLE
jgi:hypothetical protein